MGVVQRRIILTILGLLTIGSGRGELPMTDSIGKHLLMVQLIFVASLYSLYAQAEDATAVMSKVTIVVDGMMKSKSGAT